MTICSAPQTMATIERGLGCRREIEIDGKRTFTVEAGVQFRLNNTTPATAAKVQLTVAY